jgi:adenylosuccinate synthase
LDEKHFMERLTSVMEYHNFMLTNYYQVDAVDIQQVADTTLARVERLRPMIGDVTQWVNDHITRNEAILFEGAQGTWLDIDHGTYPYVTSSNTVAGGAACGSGVGPVQLHEVIGIVKAYTTRVGSGPFPTELFDDDGQYLGERGHEFGATTGRQRRCGWLDGVMLKRSAVVNTLTGLCVTKLDVLDGLKEIKVCTAYRYNGVDHENPPLGESALAQCEPVYETLPGWEGSVAGVRSYDALPANAKSYLQMIEDYTGVPVKLISTGAERADTIVRQNPFGE